MLAFSTVMSDIFPFILLVSTAYGNCITLYNFIHESLKCVILYLLIAQDSRVTLKMIFADGIKTTATILTGRSLMGWITPLGLVGPKEQHHMRYTFNVC